MPRIETSREPAEIENAVLAGIRRAILELDRSVPPEAIHPRASLVDDLGMDSIKFVGLAIALEEELDISEFPMQDWLDEETSRGPDGFKIASLMAACTRALREGKHR